jgi:hypothetical protein
MDRREEYKLLASCHTKLLENGLMQDGVKYFHHIHLQYHPIEMDI